MVKEKTISEKIKELKGRPGEIRLTKRDKEMMIKSLYNYIRHQEEERDKYTWFLIGIGVGIYGNFVTMLIYDLLKSFNYFYFILVSVALCIIFIGLLFILLLRLKDYEESISLIQQVIQILRSARSIKVGPPIKIRNFR